MEAINAEWLQGVTAFIVGVCRVSSLWAGLGEMGGGAPGEGVILVNGEEGEAESEEARVPGAESL